MTDSTTIDTRLTVPLTVNGERRTVTVTLGATLLQTLRDDLGYTSPRGTCEIGVCGSCTVLVDNKVTSSCIMLTAQARDHEVTTSEGLRGPAGELSAVQKAFIHRGAYQCSFCIPAMVLAVHAAVSDDAGRDREAVREYLAGNLCRCGTYPEILGAVTDLVGGSQHDDRTGSPS